MCARRRAGCTSVAEGRMPGSDPRSWLAGCVVPLAGGVPRRNGTGELRIHARRKVVSAYSLTPLAVVASNGSRVLSLRARHLIQREVLRTFDDRRSPSLALCACPSPARGGGVHALRAAARLPSPCPPPPARLTLPLSFRT